MPLIILKAPNNIYQKVKFYETELKEIDKFKNKFKRFFSKKKNEELENIKGCLKKYCEDLQRLSYEYREDDKLYKMIQKVLNKCKKMCKSHKIPYSEINPTSVKMFGSEIKSLILVCMSIINKTLKGCTKVSDVPAEFTNSINSEYSKIKSGLKKIEYIDLYVAKLLVVFDVLGIIFNKNHWYNAVNFQKEIMNLFVNEEREIEELEISLGQGKMNWRDACEILRSKRKTLEEKSPSAIEKWKNCYFSKEVMRRTFESEAVKLIFSKNDIFEKFKLHFGISDDIKEAINGDVCEELKEVLNSIENQEDKGLKKYLEEIMKNKFDIVVKNIEDRETFEQSCKEVYIFNEKLDKKAIKDACSMYDVLVKGKSLGNDTSVECDYRLKDSNCESVFDCTLGKNSKDALELAKELWKSRGNADIEVGVRGYLFGKKTGKSMRVPGAISV